MNESEGARAGERSLSPQEAAEALGVSPSGLRRLAEIYSGVRGDLPRDPRTRSRIWPERAVSELGAARRLVLQNRAASIREALEALDRGETVPERRIGAQRASPQLLERMAEDLHSLHDELELVRVELAEMRSIGAEMRSMMAELSGELAGERELHELRRRLRYLQAELEMREL
ncbi:MAG: hypothetical protein WD314_13775 [Trueperaceae bacterium]